MIVSAVFDNHCLPSHKKTKLTYLHLTYIHLISVFPAFLIGAFLFLNRKGTPLHKGLGKIYMILMLITGVITLLMPAEVGPRILEHFGFIHIFSFLVLYSVPKAYSEIKKNNLIAHKISMISTYVGGILIAGAFAFAPGRLLHTWLSQLLS